LALISGTILPRGIAQRPDETKSLGGFCCQFKVLENSPCFQWAFQQALDPVHYKHAGLNNRKMGVLFGGCKKQGICRGV